MPVQARIGKAVPLTRVDHHLERLAESLQLVGELLRVLTMDVVVDAAMNQQHLPVQLGRGKPRRGVAIAARIVARRLHVALGVDRVVVAPVGHRRADDAGRPAGAVGERVRRHEPAVTPAVQRDARRVDVRLRLEPRDAILEIAQFQLAELAVNRPLRLRALAARAAVVEHPDDHTMLREQLVIHVGGAAPLVAHVGAGRPGVGQLVDRIAARWIEVGRLDQHPVHHEAVSRLHFDELRLRQLELRQRFDRVGIDDAHLGPVRAMEPDLRRRDRVAPHVDVLRERGIENGAMCSLGASKRASSRRR